MKNVLELLKEHGIEVEEEKAKAFEKDVLANYKTVAEFEQKTSKLEESQKRVTELEGKVGELTETIESLNDDAKGVDDLKQQIEKFKQSEAERKQAEEAAQKRATFDGLFNGEVAKLAKDGKELSGGLMREAITEKAYQMHSANPDMKMSTIISEITKDDPNAWVNPQRDPHKMPIPGESLGTKPGINSLDDLKKLSSQQINENWDRVKEILATSKKG